VVTADQSFPRRAQLLRRRFWLTLYQIRPSPPARLVDRWEQSASSISLSLNVGLSLGYLQLIRKGRWGSWSRQTHAIKLLPVCGLPPHESFVLSNCSCNLVSKFLLNGGSTCFLFIDFDLGLCYNFGILESLSARDFLVLLIKFFTASLR